MVAVEGKKAPAFSLPAVGGDEVSLKDYEGKRAVVLYFYPKDDTPGCTTEACDFRDRSEEMKKLGAVVLGVSPDSLESHEKFAAKHTLNFPLLSDAGHEVSEKYGVWVEKNMYGRKFMGIERSTFLIDKSGRIARAWRKVKVKDHGQDVVDALKELKDEEEK